MKLIKTIKSVNELVNNGDKLLNLTIQDINLDKVNIKWEEIKLANTTFLGCKMSKEIEDILRKKGAIIYPRFVGYPFNPYRKKLYTWQELMEGYDPDNDQSRDLKIYTHFNHLRYKEDINETFAQRIHDHSIDDALKKLLGFDENGMSEKKCVGIMGGHGVPRTKSYYSKVAVIAKKLAEKGYFILSGGGPGVMEAANLGAYFANKSDSDLLNGIEILKEAPTCENKKYISQAIKVLEKYPRGETNLAIPTWFYGHEPSNVFATHIAKYFANSIREDVLLGASLYGVIYAPGSAGTLQEVFADITQNHYKTYGYVSPMVFFGNKFWKEKMGIYSFIRKFSIEKEYHDMMLASDNPDEIVNFICTHPPVK
jgi:predicted Rossmann-fold nucleotide-binding protein